MVTRLLTKKIGRARNPTNGIGLFKSFLPNEGNEELGIPHHGSVWFVQVLSTTRVLTNC